MYKLIFSFTFFLVMTMAGMAQKNYFVYIQTEGSQPFFVKMNDKIYGSTASGYIILSKLKDSIYNFSIGFPNNKIAEQKFVCRVQTKDHGFLLKSFNEKGWGLFDLQTASIQMATVSEKKLLIESTAQEVNTFTDILSKAANDSTIRHKPIIAKAEEKNSKIEEPPVAKKEELKDPPAVIKEEKKTELLPKQINNKEEVKSDIKQSEMVKAEVNDQLPSEIDQKNNPAYEKSRVIKKSESSTTEGFGLVFTDEYAGKKDTIRILIPHNKGEVLTEPKPDVNKEDKKFLEINSDNTQKAENSSAVVKTKTNNCRDVASENDFLKLRKKMAAENTDDDMIGEAKKYYKLKCFTTQQVKNLSALFLTNSGKYSFFDVSYLYVSDLENFASLESEIKDEYFLKRFRSIIRE